MSKYSTLSIFSFQGKRQVTIGELADEMGLKQELLTNCLWG